MRSVVLVVTHLLGVGHLARMAAIGRGLAAAGDRVTLVSGGRHAPLVSTAGLCFVQLPAVHCRGVDFRTLLDDEGRPIGTQLRERRVAMLLEALADAAPDILVTETFPFGRRQLADEFSALLDAAIARPNPPAILASVRDILNPPAKPERAVEAEERLGRYFDAVLVHGDETVAPLAASWPVSALAARLVYTGYVLEQPRVERQGRASSGEVLVSGGGSAASLPLYRAAIEAANLTPAGPPWHILVGHGVSVEDYDALRRQAGVATIERARADFPALLSACMISVSQAGYNTAIDLVARGTRAVLVPFEQGKEEEQRIRAERLAELGFADLVPEAELNGATLSRAIATSLGRGVPPPYAIRLDGVSATGRAIADAAAANARLQAAWTRLDTALAKADADERTIEVWWRDDDACAATPALERLLALAERHAAPVAIAVIPAKAEASLAERLLRAPLASILVHGYAHANHSPPGASKQELGHRPLADITSELAASLARLRSQFGERCLPVLVPPWNRIDPTLVEHLEGLGFRGLSTAGQRRARRVAGLAIANSHWDPIDWRGHRSLLDEADLIEGIASFIEEGRDEPLGLLTHHLAHDSWIWAATERLLERLSSHSSVRMLRAEDIFFPFVTGVPKPHIRVEPRTASE